MSKYHENIDRKGKDQGLLDDDQGEEMAGTISFCCIESSILSAVDGAASYR